MNSQSSFVKILEDYFNWLVFKHNLFSYFIVGHRYVRGLNNRNSIKLLVMKTKMLLIIGFTVVMQFQLKAQQKPEVINTELELEKEKAMEIEREKQKSMIQNMKIPMEDFFKNPVKTQFKISPDGKYFACLAPLKSRMNVFVQKVDSKDSFSVTSVTDRNIAAFTWANSSTIIYSKDNGGDENYVLYKVDIDSKQVKALTPEKDVRSEIIDELWSDLDHVLVQTNQNNASVFDVYLLNINTGEMTLTVKNPGNITGWLADHEGKVRIATSTDGVNSSLLYRSDVSDVDWKPLLSTNFRESVSPLFFTFDNKNLFCSSNLGRDKAAIVVFDLETGKESAVIYEHPEVDVYNLNYSHYRQVLTTVTYETDKNIRHFIDPFMQNHYEFVQNQLPGYEISFSSTNRIEDVFIVRTYSDKSLGAYYFYNSKLKELKLIDQISPWIDESKMCDMQPFEYKTRDGLLIHGYLTLPKNRAAVNLPLVVNPHGGPWARDSWGFNPEVQFLANRGYAVLQMNFRGSVGYGKSFWESSFKQWGKNMQNDITDGVNSLIEDGIVDRERVAIYGASYGGYATLAGLAYTPDLYACGVDYVGVSNLLTFMKTIPPYWEPYLEMMYEMVGDPKKEEDLLKAASPVFHADKITAPLLIAQGAKDPRVNVDESNQMVEALRNRGVEVEYLLEPEEGHGFSNEENRFKFYRSMETFLARYLGARN